MVIGAPSGCTAMVTPGLSPVFLDDRPVQLAGDPRPLVGRILEAGGRRRDQPVMWVREPHDPLGRPVDPDEAIDRTVKAQAPVFLQSMTEIPQGLATNLAPLSLVPPEPESDS